MPLILAIEPDTRQASLVSDLARELADDTELILTASASEAIQAIEAKVPDLILTSTLLSPSDESILTERLRKLDSAGAHVQTLVIPLLAERQAEPEPQAGLLSRLGWKKRRSSTPDGCDPAVFGGQIEEYLNRSHVLRRAFTSLPSSILVDESRPVEERPWEPTAAAPVLLPSSDLVRDSAAPLDLFKPEEPPIGVEEPEPFAQTASADPVEPAIALEDSLVALEDPAPPETPWSEPLVSDIDALSAELDAVLAAHASMPAPEASATGPPDAPEPVPAIEQPEAEVRVEEPFRTDLLELLAAIQLDLEPLRSAPDVRPLARVKPAGRIEDEWGFFDPQQCGMAALLTRLDEMARQRDAGSAPE
jgi:CheY-like chemotaxis protein